MIPEISWGFRLFLVILTCYRLAKMIADDDGPLFIFKRFRYVLKDEAYIEATKNGVWSNLENMPNDRWFGFWHNLSEGFSCAYCVGVWVSLPLFYVLLYPTPLTDGFLILMSISGGQAFLQSLKK